MNAKISVFLIFVDAIIYLLLYDSHDCIFNTYYFRQLNILKTIAKSRRIIWKRERAETCASICFCKGKIL